MTSLRWRTVQHRILRKPGFCSLWRRHCFDARWTQNCLAWGDFDKTASQHKSTQPTYCSLFAGNSLLTAPEPASECYVIERFVGTVVQRFVCVKALCAGNRTEHLWWSIRVRDEVATWVSERSTQSNSATFLWANIGDIYRRNFADTIHRQHRISCADTSVEF